MKVPSFDTAVKRIRKRDQRFDARAYFFLKEALDFTILRIAAKEQGETRHISGQELLAGFCEYALDQFGPMAAIVMREWGVKNGINVGEMVYSLIEEEIFSKQDEDDLDDFKNFMSFRKALEEPFEPKNEQQKESE